MNSVQGMRWITALMLMSASYSGASAQQSPQVTTFEPQPSFEVASIKPSKPDDRNHGWNSGGDRVAIENYTLRRLIRTAYGLKSDSQVMGGPDWIGKRAFDIEAKFGDAETAKMQKMTGREKFREARLAVQALLTDRFQLQISQESRSIAVYALEVTKTGAKLKPSTPQLDDDGKPRTDKSHTLNDNNGHLTAIAISMGGFADWFVYQPECDRVVVDRTGLAGEYDFKLDWTEDRGQGLPPDATLPGLFTALHEQLGLELKPDKAPVDVVVVQAAKEPELD
jgi:uncharacterized protein (TIGR03435 family)